MKVELFFDLFLGRAVFANAVWEEASPFIGEAAFPYKFVGALTERLQGSLLAGGDGCCDEGRNVVLVGVFAGSLGRLCVGRAETGGHAALAGKAGAEEPGDVMAGDGFCGR